MGSHFSLLQSTDPVALVPPHIQKLTPYKAGKPAEELARELGLEHIVKLASNENPMGPSKQALQAAGEALREAHRYPDPAAFELRTALAARFQVKLDNVITGSGSEGIMATILRTFLFEDDEMISAANSFIGFRVLAHASGRKVHWIAMQNYRYDLEAISAAINDKTKIIYLANPDNPTGTYFPADTFEAFIKQVPERVLVILDEAYFEYAAHLPDFPDSMSYRLDNVITLRTFSKAYGLAGLRVGYGFGHEALIGNLLKVKLPFEPSRPAQAAALAALSDASYLEEVLRLNGSGMALLSDAFAALDMTVIPSAANFLTLVLASEESAQQLCEAMLRRGVILRHLAPFGWPSLVRVTVGLPTENEYLIEQLNDYWRTSNE